MFNFLCLFTLSVLPSEVISLLLFFFVCLMEEFAGDKFSIFFFSWQPLFLLYFWFLFFVTNKIFIWKLFSFITLKISFHYSRAFIIFVAKSVKFLLLLLSKKGAFFLCLLWRFHFFDSGVQELTTMSRNMNTGWDSKTFEFYGLMPFTGLGKFPANISSHVVTVYFPSPISETPVADMLGFTSCPLCILCFNFPSPSLQASLYIFW